MPETIREVVALFDDAEALEEAVFALETLGFDRAAFSLLADEATVERKLGHRYQRVTEMEDEPRAPRATFFSRISRLEAEYGPAAGLAALGALALTGVGGILPVLVAAGGGAVLGGALGSLMHRHYARLVEEQLARGGLLLWVNVRDAAQENTALEILRAHTAQDVHTHEIEA
ncbi:MAG: hypothetical protein KGJ66_12795 [Alphaproteobacteria bacterium]|nr:hypothetical protein [Alphaproteobacteria bacterium]